MRRVPYKSPWMSGYCGNYYIIAHYKANIWIDVLTVRSPLITNENKHRLNVFQNWTKCFGTKLRWTLRVIVTSSCTCYCKSLPDHDNGDPRLLHVWSIYVQLYCNIIKTLTCLRKCGGTQSSLKHFPWSLCAFYFAPRNSIGLGRFVYHIWQGSGWTRKGIGREQPSFTKFNLTGFYKQRIAWWEMKFSRKQCGPETYQCVQTEMGKRVT